MNAEQKLRQMVTELRGSTNPAQAKASWELVGRLLGRSGSNPAEAARLCAARDLDALDSLVTRIEGGGASPRSVSASAASVTPGAPPSDADMESALRAFRKRLKLTRLSDESKLAGRRLTGGRQSEIDAIIPPHEFSDEVWKALAAAGKLKNTGRGFYALPDHDRGA